MMILFGGMVLDSWVKFWIFVKLIIVLIVLFCLCWVVLFKILEFVCGLIYVFKMVLVVCFSVLSLYIKVSGWISELKILRCVVENLFGVFDVNVVILIELFENGIGSVI